MSRIEEMIRDLCPDGVKRVRLDEVFELRNGYTPSKSNPAFWEGGTIPWYRMEDIRENGRILSDSIQHITPAAIKGKGLFEAGSFILATTATIGEHALLIADSLANQRFTNLKIRKSLENSLLTKFVFYYFDIIDEFCKSHTNRSGFESVDMDALKAMPFPLPPLAIQEKIVEILEKFSLLSAELEAELEGRRKQYDFYRNRLLSFDSGSVSELNEGRRQDESSASIDPPSTLHQRSINASSNVEWKKLGEIVKIKNGKDYKHLAAGNVPVYGTGGIMTYVDQYVYDKPTVLLPRKGSIEKVYFVNTPFWNVDTVYYTEIDETKVLPKYLYYCFTNINLASYNTATGAIPSLTQAVLNNIQFPIPPLAEQERIVRILDKFEALVTDLSAGLPAEIERVQKQYEYYRNKLLTFPEA